MRFFEIDMDEDHLRRFIKAVIDQYERGLHDYGNYQDAVQVTQDTTIQNFEDNAEAMESMIDNQERMH